ncbi:nucleotidyltransferase family protein [Paraglaciecola sp.]|uniref:nucleotidyltransferase family protein n=1 Tax=Paraglaciecola sp. TaxID=1920173 RepID=UPI003EF9C1A9
MNNDKDEAQVTITQQTFYDLGTWLSKKQQYTQTQLLRLQLEEHYLPLVALANNNWLTGALANSLKKSDVWLLIPTTLREYLSEMELFYRQRSESIQQEAIFSCSLLLDAGTEVSLLKGAANLFNGAANPISNRYMSDIDLLIQESKLDDSVTTLVENGYVDPDDDEEILIKGDAHHHAPPLIRKDGVCYIELHRWALPLSSHKILETNEIWQQSIPLSLTPELEILQPHPTHQIILAITHSELSDSAFKNNHIDLRQLYNLYSLTKNLEGQIDWSVVEQHFQRANLAEVLYAMLFSTYQIFGLRTPATKIKDSSAQKHYSSCLDRYVKTQGDNPKFSYLLQVFRGYEKQTIIDLYGNNGRYPIIFGRLKHFKRHLHLLFTPKFITRFVKRNFNKD